MQCPAVVTLVRKKLWKSITQCVSVIKMAAFNIQEALVWKEKIEQVIDQHQVSQVVNGNKYISFEYESGSGSLRNASFSEHDSQLSTQEDMEDSAIKLRTTIGNGTPEAILDWTCEIDSDLSENASKQVFSRKHWRLLQCQNGLRIFEELSEVDYLPRSCSRAMRAVGIVEATCEEIFELVMSMDETRYEWDCSFQQGNLIEEVDRHTAVIYHQLQLDWFSMFVWPRDLCYMRYWRRNDDGSYVVLFRSRVHQNCDPQPGFVRAHLESGGFNICPLTPRNGRSRSQVQHLMQIDLRGWGVGYFSSFQQHCLFQMLSSIAGLREYFAQTDGSVATPRIPVPVNMTSSSMHSKKSQNHHESSFHPSSPNQYVVQNRSSVVMDEDSDDYEDYQLPEACPEGYSSMPENEAKKSKVTDQIDLNIFSGTLKRNDNENARSCWRISDGNNFKVRSKSYCRDKAKVPAGKHLMNLVAVDWFKDSKRMDHVARRQGCAAQVAVEKGAFCLVINVQVPAGSTHYSMVFYFVTTKLIPGSLLQRFVDGDDEFRNGRLKLVPSVHKGSWFVRQSVGSTPCLLGKAIDCNYIRQPSYLEVDVDIGSSTVANGVLGMVIGVITTLVVDMAFLVQANSEDELPERLIGAVRACHIDLSSAVAPNLPDSPDE